MVLAMVVCSLISQGCVTGETSPGSGKPGGSAERRVRQEKLNSLQEDAAERRANVSSLKKALQVWRERLAFFQAELARTSDPTIKFTLQQQIEEAKKQIDSLSKEIAEAEKTITPEPNPEAQELRMGPSGDVSDTGIMARDKRGQPEGGAKVETHPQLILVGPLTNSPPLDTAWRINLFAAASATLACWDVKDGLPQQWKDHFVPESNLLDGHPESGSKQNMGLEWDNSDPVSLSVGCEILHRSSSELFLGAAVATRVPFERRLTGKLDWWNRVTILEFEERQYPMLGPVLYAGLWQNTKLRAAALLYYYEQTFVDYTGVNVVNGSNYSVALPERDESGVGCRLEAGINVPFGKSGWAVPVTAFYEQSGADVWSAGLGLGVTFGVDIGQSH
jgi:hypothetical protein